MAFATTTAWDVRTTGSDANGGGFDTAATGTDYSQQNSPQFTYTDLVIDGTTNTKITSAAFPFDSTSPGNIINVTSGTGFTVQRVQVVSVAAGVATCDKAVGTLSSTGGNGKMGGSFLTVDMATKNTTPLFVGGNSLYIKAGTYTRTTTWALDTSSNSGNLYIEGYQTTHGDGGTKPLITTATNSIKLIQASPSLFTLNNLSLSNTAGTRADGIWFVTTSTGFTLINCTLDGFVVGANGDNGAGGAGAFQMFGVEVKNCTSDGVRAWFASCFHGCYIHANGGDGVQASTTTQLTFTETLLVGNTGRGAGASGANSFFFLTNCTIANNTSDGIGNGNALATVMLQNCIIYGNGGWGVNVSTGVTTSNRFTMERNCAFGSNTSGNTRTTFPTYNQIGAITLTAGPFTNSGAGDYSLNSTAGGGTACKAAGFPGTFPAGLTVGAIDVGAVQTAAGGGSSGMLYIPNLDGV